MPNDAPSPPNLLSPEHIADPWPGLAVLRDHYPVHWDETVQAVVITRYDAVRKLKREIEPGMLLQELLGQYLSDAVSIQALDGRDHRKRRALMAPYLSRGGVESFASNIETVARQLLDPIVERERRAIAGGVRERGEMDFIQEFTGGFTVSVMFKILGIEMNERSRLREWFDAWIAAEGNISQDPAIKQRALRAKDDFTDFFEPLLAERRRDGGGDDLISKMLRAEVDGFSLPDDDIRSLIAAMMLAGGETTDHQLGWLMYELTKDPRLQGRLIDDRALMDRVLAEGMRHGAVVQFIGRVAPDDLEVDGTEIAKGSPLALGLASANHDPRRFANPEMFDVDRADHDPAKAFNGSAEHMGFGTGAHFCIGSHLTKYEMEIAMNTFFDRVRDVRLVEDFIPQADPEGFFVRSLPSLRISFQLQ